MTHVPGCTGKVKHATRAEAEFFITRHPDPDWTASGERRGPQYVYHCEACGCWHTSRMTQEQAARQHARVKREQEHNRKLVAKLLAERGIEPRGRQQKP